jgi:4-hydroxy 2-oxovalerate aldolase
MRELTVLDCTFRDGGYYTDWQFDADLVSDYVEIVDELAVDVVELGYVRLGDDARGSFRDLPAGLDAHLGDGSRTRFAVMVDANSFDGRSPQGVVHELKAIVSASSLPITVIRVAVNYAKLAAAIDTIRALVDADFQVCVNLMQIDVASRDEERTCLDALARLDHVDAVYLADSLGSMRPERVTQLIRKFATQSPHAIGFHAHDNQGLALANSLAAIEAGASWIDATMAGMGRGAGNAKTEQLLGLLLGREPQTALFAFVARWFHPLLARYGWGASVFYAIAGQQYIHPTYVQRLEEDASVGVGEKLEALEFLGRAGASSFRSELMHEAVGAHA